MKDYFELFTNIVAPHLHKLVELVSSSRRMKVLVHEWVLEIEYNWPEYAIVSDDDSDFIARLSFWIGGLREKFKSNPSKKDVIELLNKTFDASTFCYFEFGARDDIERQIEFYCTQVDDFFNERILSPKLKRFRLSKEAIPLINRTIKILEYYHFKFEHVKFRESIEDASELETELLSLFRRLLNGFIKITESNFANLSEINEKFLSFLSCCNKIGYNDVFLVEDQKNLILAYKSILNNYPTNGEEIINSFFNLLPKLSTLIDTLILKNEFEFIKDSGYLKLKIVNIIRIPKKNLKITIKHGLNKSVEKFTDKSGVVLFNDLSKGDISILINSSKKAYTMEIDTFYNEKIIWLFSF
jgi:hypothetical protein